MKKLLWALLLLYPLSAGAQTYEWTDDRGTVNFADDLGKVPKKYRKKAKPLGASDSGTPQVIETTEPVKGKGKDQGKEAGRDTGEKEAKPLYGGKDEKAWRTEIGSAKSQLQAAERDLAGLRDRLGDTSKLSRSEYLSIQATIKHNELRVEDLKKQLGQLRRKAEKLEVPLDEK